MPWNKLNLHLSNSSNRVVCSIQAGKRECKLQDNMIMSNVYDNTTTEKDCSNRVKNNSNFVGESIVSAMKSKAKVKISDSF